MVVDGMPLASRVIARKYTDLLGLIVVNFCNVLSEVL